MASAIVIDGSNLCRAHKTKLAHLELLEKAIAQIETIMSADDVLKVYVDASLPYGLNDPDKKRLEYLISTGKITKAPAGVEADGFILRWAAKKNAIVISNDLYRDYVTSFPWIKEKGSGRFVCGDYDEADKSWTFLERSAATTNARSIEQLINRPKSDPLFLDQSGIQSLIDSTPKPRTSKPPNKSKLLETLKPEKDLNQKLFFHDFVGIWGISRHNALTIINSEKYNQALKAPRNEHVIIHGSRVQLTQHGLNTLKELAEVIRSNDPPPKPKTSQPSNKSKLLETLEPENDLNQKLLFHDFVAIWGISRHNALTIINSEKYNQALRAPRNDHVIISGSRVQLTQHGLNTLKELAEVIRSNDPPPIHGRY